MSYNNCQFTWLEQKETLVSLVESLFKESSFYDCLLCAEGRYFKAHRVILSYNSPVFSSVLQDHNSDLPVITLEGISSIELGALVEFMYTGVTRIPPKYLKSFFDTARSIQLAGLDYYDNAQIEKIIKDCDVVYDENEYSVTEETCNQKIISYLDQTGEIEGTEMKFVNSENERMFLEDTEIVDLEGEDAVVYRGYSDSYSEVKEEESLRTKFIEDDSSLICDPGDSNDSNRNKASVVFTENFQNTFSKIHNRLFSSASSGDELINVEEPGEDYIQLPKDIKLKEEDNNFVFVKLEDGILNRLTESSPTKVKKRDSKEDVRYPKKSITVINPTEKTFVLKRPKIQSLIAKDSKAGNDDKKIYICLKCGNKYSHRRTLLHHIHWICEQPATYSCKLCPYRGKRKFQLKSHMKHAHLIKMS